MVRMLVKYGDERLSVPQAAKRIGISVTAMYHRLRAGWPKEKLFSPDKHIRGGRSRTSREYSWGTQTREKNLQCLRDFEIDKRMGKSHAFTIFRLGTDACAKCGKPRKEHG